MLYWYSGALDMSPRKVGFELIELKGQQMKPDPFPDVYDLTVRTASVWRQPHMHLQHQAYISYKFRQWWRKINIKRPDKSAMDLMESNQICREVFSNNQNLAG